MISSLSVNTTLLQIPSFKILGNQYLTPSFRFTKTGNPLIAWSEISSLYEPIIYPSKLMFELSFPFPEPIEFTIYPTDKGFTRQMIIDEIRRAYRHLFRHSNVPAARWESVVEKGKETKYHVFYPHSHLFVDRIYFDHKTERLDIKVEGLPKPNMDFNLPF